jgi:CRP-like cAMP-binding protein
MQAEARSWRKEAAAAHPLAELLACPAATGNLLNHAAQSIDYLAGEMVFSQMGVCRGLYVIAAGRFLRKTERLEARLTLGTVSTGDLVELAAVLGSRFHTYTLSAQTAGSVLLLPIQALERAFESHPPLRMQLLGELAREVSRAYDVCCLDRILPARRRHAQSAQA